MTGDKTAVLVIDVQRELFTHDVPVYKADEVLHNINTLVARAHAAGAPVVYVQQCNDTHLLADSEGWQLHLRLQPVPGDVMVRKTHGSAFEDTVLADELARRSVGRVIVTGLATHACVKATTLAAIELGYKTTLVADAHSNSSKDAARLVDEWNQRLAEAGARLATTEDVTFDNREEEAQ